MSLWHRAASTAVCTTVLLWIEVIFTESLIYSLNATVPVFLVIVIGYVLNRMGMFNEGFISAANKFIFKLSLIHISEPTRH